MSEEFSPIPDWYGPDNGGGLFSEQDDFDGVVAYTKYGELVCERDAMGGMVAEFPEHGLTFFYKEGGDLEKVWLDLGDYLAGLGAEAVLDMPNNGTNIYEIVKYLYEQKIIMYLNLEIDKGTLELVVVNCDGEAEVKGEIDTANLKRGGIIGTLDVGESQLTYEFTDYGDNMLVAVGETSEEATKLAGMEFSSFVDFVKDYNSNDPQRFNRLAEKIILQ